MAYEVVFKKKKKISKEYLVVFISLLTILIEYYVHNIVGLNLITTFLCLTLNLVLIGIIGEFLLNSSTKLSIKLNASPFLLGLILIPMFSSLPEDFITILQNLKEPQLAEFTLAQILGNNLFELLIIFGISGVLTCQFSKKCITVPEKDKPIFLINGLILMCGSILVFLLIFFDRNLSFSDGLILLLFYALFMGIIFFFNKLVVKETGEISEEVIPKEEINGIRELVFIVVFIVLVLFCGDLFVSDVLFLAQKSTNFEKFSFLYIGIAIAIPELVLAIIGFIKGKEELVLGMVIGGTIWDMIVSVAIQGLVNPIYNISFIVLLFFLIMSLVGIAIALLYIRTKWKLKIWESIILIIIYIAIVIIVIVLY
jgi:cation:H+ antiporter